MLAGGDFPTRMRVALLHYTASPVVGGVERVMAAHARLFRDAGHRVTVYCGEGAGEEVRVLPELRRSAAGVDAARLVELLEPLLAGEEIVFLHNVCTMPFHPALTAALGELAGRLTAVRLVCWVHDLEPAPPASPHLAYVAVSPLRQRQIHECLGVPPERCPVIPNGLWPLEHWGVPEDLGALLTSWRILERELVLLHPARLLRRKNVEFSLGVLAALRSEGMDAALLVTAPADPHRAASAAYREELLRLRHTLGLEGDACFLSDHLALTEAGLDSLYRLADAVLFPSRQEGFGLPILEAALHRVPIFCPDLEPIRSLLRTGPICYPPESPAAEVAALLMRQLKHSPAIQARRELLQGYSWSAVYRNLIAPLLVTPQNHPHP